MSVYGSPAEIDFLRFFVGAVHSVRPDFVPPMDPPPPEFRLADPETLRSELVQVGLKDVQVDQLTEYTEFKSSEFLWEWIIWSNPIVEMILGMLNVTNDERYALEKTMHTLWEERAGASGVATLGAPINIGWGQSDLSNCSDGLPCASVESQSRLGTSDGSRITRGCIRPLATPAAGEPQRWMTDLLNQR
jgi:hypothetical protein